MTDKYGNQLNIGDSICFSLQTDWRQTPMVVSAKIDGFSNSYIILGEYRQDTDYNRAEKAGKLISKVSPNRVIKCY